MNSVGLFQRPAGSGPHIYEYGLQQSSVGSNSKLYQMHNNTLGHDPFTAGNQMQQRFFIPHGGRNMHSIMSHNTSNYGPQQSGSINMTEYR